MITSSVEKISPNRAREMMNGSNCRRLRQKKMLQYASDMSKGKWTLTGEAIIYDKNGKLINGFHRLNAVKLSGMTIQSLVVRGVEPYAVGDIDVGAVRSGGDFLYIKEGPDNIKYEKAVAASLNYIAWYETNKFQGGRVLLNNNNLYTSFKKHEGIVDSIGKAFANKNGLLSISVAGAFHYLFSQKDEELADRFLEQLSNGLAESTDDPFHVLREKLVFNKTTKAKITRENLIKYVVVAWNLKRKGQKVKRLTYQKGRYSTTIK